MIFYQFLAGLLVLLAPVHWWALVVVSRAARASPTVRQLRQQRIRFGISAACATLLAAIAVNYLIGSPLPRGAGFVALVAVLLLISGPPVVFLVDYYRPADGT